MVISTTTSSIDNHRPSTINHLQAEVGILPRTVELRRPVVEHLPPLGSFKRGQAPVDDNVDPQVGEVVPEEDVRVKGGARLIGLVKVRVRLEELLGDEAEKAGAVGVFNFEHFDDLKNQKFKVNFCLEKTF